MFARYWNPSGSGAATGSIWRRGFTLVEFLVVLGIIAVLIALILPATRTSRRAARRMQCASNLKQITQALFAYEQAYQSLPPVYTVDASGRPLHSWRTLILPYLEQEPLYRTIDLVKAWDDPANAEARNSALLVFRCPEAVGPPNTTTYRAIHATGGCFHTGQARRLAEIEDPRESTLMMIEAGGGDAVPWMSPVDADESLILGLGPATKVHHAGGTHVCFVDGHVSFLKVTTRPEIRRALISISGHENDVVKDW